MATLDRVKDRPGDGPQGWVQSMWHKHMMLWATTRQVGKPV